MIVRYIYSLSLSLSPSMVLQPMVGQSLRKKLFILLYPAPFFFKFCISFNFRSSITVAPPCPSSFFHLDFLCYFPSPYSPFLPSFSLSLSLSLSLSPPLWYCGPKPAEKIVHSFISCAFFLQVLYII